MRGVGVDSERDDRGSAFDVRRTERVSGSLARGLAQTAKPD